MDIDKHRAALAALLGVTTWPDAPRLRRALVAATPDADAAPLLRWSYDLARGSAARPTLAAWAAVLGVAPEALRGRVWRLRRDERIAADALPVDAPPRAPRVLSTSPTATRSRDYRARVVTGDVGPVGRPAKTTKKKAVAKKAKRKMKGNAR